MIGPKIVERGDGYKIVRFPFWVTEAAIRRAMEMTRKDAAVSGRRLTITIGHRLVRIEENEEKRLAWGPDCPCSWCQAIDWTAQKGSLHGR